MHHQRRSNIFPTGSSLKRFNKKSAIVTSFRAKQDVYQFWDVEVLEESGKSLFQKNVRIAPFIFIFCFVLGSNLVVPRCCRWLFTQVSGVSGLKPVMPECKVSKYLTYDTILPIIAHLKYGNISSYLLP